MVFMTYRFCSGWSEKRSFSMEVSRVKRIGQSRIATQLRSPLQAKLAKDFGQRSWSGFHRNPTTNSVGGLRPPVGTEGSNLEHRRCSEEEFGELC